MARIPEPNRLPVVDANIGHWTEANVVAGSPIEIVAGYGLPQFHADRAAYHTKTDEITQIADNDLPILRAERDAIWGVSPQDDDGVWFRLTQYKSMVRARLGARHPLTRTVPNIGPITVERYLTIFHQFIDHWERVNAALTPDTSRCRSIGRAGMNVYCPRAKTTTGSVSCRTKTPFLSKPRTFLSDREPTRLEEKTTPEFSADTFG